MRNSLIFFASIGMFLSHSAMAQHNCDDISSTLSDLLNEPDAWDGVDDLAQNPDTPDGASDDSFDALDPTSGDTSTINGTGTVRVDGVTNSVTYNGTINGTRASGTYNGGTWTGTVSGNGTIITGTFRDSSGESGSFRYNLETDVGTGVCTTCENS